MKTIEERAKAYAGTPLPTSKVRELRVIDYTKGATEQKEQDIKALSRVYADLLSAKGYDVGTINSELARLQKEINEE